MRAPLASAAPQKCPAARVWFEEGSFAALDGGLEPWRDSRRAPTTSTSEKLVQQMLASDLKSSDAHVAATGAARCFEYRKELFHGVRADNHIPTVPHQSILRVRACSERMSLQWCLRDLAKVSLPL